MIREEFQSRQESLERSHGHKFLTYCLRTWLGNDPICGQKEARWFYHEQAFLFLAVEGISRKEPVIVSANTGIPSYPDALNATLKNVMMAILCK